jgi:hypothetical protein
MAIFTPSPIVGEIRKKAGSDVFSKNHYGPIIRKRVKPINPRSAAQTAIRSLLRGFAQGWKSLTQANILAWNALAKQITKKNSLGLSITLTGEAMFIENNLNISQVAGTPITTCPSLDDNKVENLSGVAITSTAGVLSMAFTSTTDATKKVIVRSSGKVSPGRTYNSKFKSFYVFVSNATSPQDLSSAFNALFGGALATGEVAFFEYRVVDSLTGFASRYEKVRIIGS